MLRDQRIWPWPLCLLLPLGVAALEMWLDVPWWLTGGGIYAAFVLAALCWPIKRLVMFLAGLSSILITAAHLQASGFDPIPVERHLHCGLWVSATFVTAYIVLQRSRARNELDQFFALSPDTMCIGSLQGSLIRINDAGRELLGITDDSIELPALLDKVHENDREQVLGAVEQIRAGRAVTGISTRIIGPSEFGRAILWSAVPEAILSRVFVIGRDISEQASARKQLELSQEALAESEADLRKLNMRLIQASEDERRRLARELHDGVSQRLALLAGSAASERPDLFDEVGDIAEDVRRISHRLHPAILDNVGLEAALESECESFQRLQGIETSCEFRTCPDSIRPDVALALYRITQEALSNVARHAKASWVRVTLAGVDKQLVLSIVDSGIGFDPQVVRRIGGLGLTSMRERARQIGANLAVSSEPDKGTEIEVEVEIEN